MPFGGIGGVERRDVGRLQRVAVAEGSRSVGDRGAQAHVDCGDREEGCTSAPV